MILWVVDSMKMFCFTLHLECSTLMNRWLSRLSRTRFKVLIFTGQGVRYNVHPFLRQNEKVQSLPLPGSVWRWQAVSIENAGAHTSVDMAHMYVTLLLSELPITWRSGVKAPSASQSPAWQMSWEHAGMCWQYRAEQKHYGHPSRVAKSRLGDSLTHYSVPWNNYIWKVAVTVGGAGP